MERLTAESTSHSYSTGVSSSRFTTKFQFTHNNTEQDEKGGGYNHDGHANSYEDLNDCDSENDWESQWNERWEEQEVRKAERFLDEQSRDLASLDPIVKEEVQHWIGLCRRGIHIYRSAEEEEVLFEHYWQVLESVHVVKILSAPDMTIAKAHNTAQKLLESSSNAIEDRHMLVACVTFILLSSLLSLFLVSSRVSKKLNVQQRLRKGEPANQLEALHNILSLLESFPDAATLFLQAKAKKRLLSVLDYSKSNSVRADVKQMVEKVYTKLLEKDGTRDEVRDGTVNDEVQQEDGQEVTKDGQKAEDEDVKGGKPVKDTKEAGSTVTKPEHSHKPLRQIFLDSFTPYSITCASLTIGLGTWKAYAVQHSAPIIGNVLDWVLGIVITIILSWIKGLESHRSCRWMFTSIFDRRRKRRRATDP